MKALFTYLRTFLLCFGLLQLQMLPVYAQAQEQQQQEDAYVQEYEDSQAQQSNGQRTSRVVSDRGEEVEGGMMGQLVNLITMMAIGMLGMVMYTYAPPTLDMKVAAAAAVAYIYGEVSALKATRDKMESKEFVLTKYSDGTEDNMQKKALEEQKKSYESLADMMDQKAMMQKVAAAGFMIAAGIALYQKAYLTSLTATCVAGVTAAAASTAAAAAACVGACAPLTAMAGYCAAASAAVASGTAADEATAAAPAPSTPNWTALAAIDATMMTAITPCTPALASCAPSSLFKKLVNTQSVVASMGAGLVVSGIMHALGLGSLSGLTSAIFLPISVAYDLVFASPVKRAIAFAALGGIVFMGSTQSSELAEKMRSNVEKIDALLRQMDKLQNVQPASLVASTQLNQNGLFLDSNRTDAQRLEARDMPCPNNKPRGADGGCSSIKKEIDAGIKETLSGADGLPEGFITSAGQIGNVADDLVNTGGLSSGSLDSANALLANSNAINNLNRRLKEDINKRLKDKGKKTIDFDQGEKQFAANLKKAVLQGINDGQSKDSARFMAAFGGIQKLPLTAEALTEGEQMVDADFVEGSDTPVAAAFQMPEAPKFSLGLGDDGFNASTDSESNLAYNDKGEMMVSVSDEYEASESSEIVSNKDVSIFKVISVRYLKSGIPKLIGLEE